MALLGTGTLVRLALQRDRIRLPAWILVTVGLVASTAASIGDLYDDPAQRQQYAETVGSNPASAAISGPGFGLTTLGGITVAEMAATTFTLVALVSMMLVVRHTRKEEETGRSELLRSAVVGRHAPLAATLLVVGGFNMTAAVGTIAALIGSGLPTPGSVVFGLELAGVGLVFAGVAAVTAQVAEHARTANASAAAIFGLAYLLRAVGDASNAADSRGVLKNLSWLSPIGWAQRARAYDDECWWLFGLLGGAIIVLVGVAIALSVRRDVGAGLVPARLGRAAAKPSLASIWALAWRLHRGGLIGWTVGVVIGATVLGSIAQDVNDMVGDNEDAAKIFAQLGGGGGGALVDSYLAWVLGIAGIAAAAYAVSAVLRLRSEETDLRAEAVLATAVKRWQWVSSHLLVAVTGTVVLLATTGAVVGLVNGIRAGNVGHELPRILGGALAQIQAAVVVAAATVALFGIVPRFSAACWALVGAAALISQLGVVLQLGQWALNVSPFTHVPKLPGTVTATPMLWLAAISVALIATGLLRFRQRDINRS